MQSWNKILSNITNNKTHIVTMPPCGLVDPQWCAHVEWWYGRYQQRFRASADVGAFYLLGHSWCNWNRRDFLRWAVRQSFGDGDPKQAASMASRVIRMIPLQVARMFNLYGRGYGRRVVTAVMVVISELVHGLRHGWGTLEFLVGSTSSFDWWESLVKRRFIIKAANPG